MDTSCSRPLRSLLFLVPSLLVFISLVLTVPASSAAAPPRGTPRYPFLPNGTAPRRGSPHFQPIANLSTTLWNSGSPDGRFTVKYDDGSVVRLLLVRRGRSGRSFACGFFCRDSCSETLFSIFLVFTNENSSISDTSSGFPQVVWSANRDRPVGEGARLELTSGGQLVLWDSETKIWDTNTLGKSVSGVNLTETGNLVLYNSTGENVWQSFDHATDTLLPGQLVDELRLIANSSANSCSEGIFYLNISRSSSSAFILSDTPEMYFSEDATEEGSQQNEGSKLLRSLSTSTREGQSPDSTERFVRLEWDGHLRLYVWSGDDKVWKAEKDLFTEWSDDNGECSHPTFCGEYGVCSTEHQCSCPTGVDGGVAYFTALDSKRPNHGCSLSTPLSCLSRETHTLLPQANISYFGYVGAADISGTDVESCKEACLRNCSCKAAFFKYQADRSKGDCYLQSRVLSLIDHQNNTRYNSSAFIKVQSASPHAARKRSTILGSTMGVLFALLLLGVVVGIVLQRRRKDEGELEGCLQHLPGMPTMFSYVELRWATDNFSNKLGEGGFGSVFQGTLSGGMMVAVKQLGGKGQGMKEFLAEVETIGSIHHVNLVRLVGYCAHKLHRLLVYEYMCNGSLDRWIFRRDENTNPATLDWMTRRNIILHVAKGLAYLHEECRHRIAHLDIKPENILLDESFNAKVSDFGLSKLIDRDQSRVVTTMRGTPGYLAPEWLSSMITVKADVFSFGVVVLETVCGRRNVLLCGSSRAKQSIPLVDEVRSAAREDRLLDVLDRNCGDMTDYPEEVMQMLRIALWCLQGDPDRRPSMSAVVKVLEGVVGIESFLDSDYSDFSAPTQVTGLDEVHFSGSTPMLASTLSGPR